MNALENIEQIVDEKAVEKIIIDGKVVARNYIFLVQKDDKNYILVNPKDWDMAIAQLYMSRDTKHLRDYLKGVPVVESFAEAQHASLGIFVCSYRVK